MEYEWYLSNIDRETRSVHICAEGGYDVGNFFPDINFLNSLALKHDVSMGVLEDEDENKPVRIVFTFSTEGNWVKFCNEFLSLVVLKPKEDEE